MLRTGRRVRGVTPADDTQIEGGEPKNFVRASVLLLLAESPAHGYELLERLRAFGFDRDPGGLYRTLRVLEHDGLVRASWEPSPIGPDRRRYEFTPAGKHHLAAWAATLAETRRALDLFLDRHARLTSPVREGR